MKLKLNPVYSTHFNYEERELRVSSFAADDVDFEITVRHVTVEITDDIDLTEKKFNEAIYLKRGRYCLVIHTNNQ
jgi:uncharacterized OsmC-like protein